MYSPARDGLLKTEADRTKRMRITLRQKYGVLPVPWHGRIKILQNYIF